MTTKNHQKQQKRKCQAVLAHACDPSSLGGRSEHISEFEASLVYNASSSIARVKQRNPVSKIKQNKQTDLIGSKD